MVDRRRRSSTAEGYEHIDRARRLLGQGGPPRETLEQAALAFWKAVLYRDTWPELLRSDAAALIAALFRHGPIGVTIARMDERSVAETMDAMREFCDLFLNWTGPAEENDPERHGQ